MKLLLPHEFANDLKVQLPADLYPDIELSPILKKLDLLLPAGSLKVWR